jgi:hypothetical protein
MGLTIGALPVIGTLRFARAAARLRFGLRSIPSFGRPVRRRYPGQVKPRDEEENTGGAGRLNSASPLSRRDTTPLLRLEGYRYDVTADFLTAQVVYASTQKENQRADVEMPICDRVRRLIDETLRLVGDAITTSVSYD